MYNTLPPQSQQRAHSTWAYTSTHARARAHTHTHTHSTLSHFPLTELSHTTLPHPHSRTPHSHILHLDIYIVFSFSICKFPWKKLRSSHSPILHSHTKKNLFAIICFLFHLPNPVKET